MNWQCFVGSAVLNSINYETLRKMGMGICRAEYKIVDFSDSDEGLSPFEPSEDAFFS